MPHANIGDISLFYKVFRQGREQSNLDPELSTMIVLHGGPGFVDHNLYVPYWSYFAIFMQVVFVDQRGNGLSDHGDPAKWNLDTCGHDIYLFCQALQIDKPIIAGISWGGYVAMAYVSQHPEHPQALLLCNTEAKVSVEARYQMFKTLGGEKAGQAAWEYDHYPTKEGVHEQFIKHCLPYYACYRSYKPEDIAQCHTNISMRTKFMKEENLVFDFRSTLNKVVCPTLLLAGEYSPGHPVTCAQQTAQSIPHQYVQLKIIKNAGAPVYNDKPAEVYACILRFIAEVDEGVAKNMPINDTALYS